MATKKNIKSIDEMRNSNIFFYECFTRGSLEEQLTNFRKHLQKLQVCYDTGFKYEAVEFLMWVYEFSYSSNLFICSPSVFTFMNFFDDLKQICYAKRDLYDLYLSFDHIADIRKYYSLNVNIFKQEDAKTRLNKLVYCIIEYINDQYKEAKGYVDSKTSIKLDVEEELLLDSCRGRLQMFIDAKPRGFWTPDQIFEQNNTPLNLGEKVNNNLQEIAQDFLAKYSLSDVYNHINNYVYKQEQAKEVMSLMFYNHMQRLANPNVEIEKRNFLMFGPTGCGKTEITRAINKISPVPVITLDCSCISGTGWSGASFGDLIYSEYENFSDFKKDLFSGSFIVLDEFDKLVKFSPVDEKNFQFDKQTAILRALEDRKITVSEKNFSRAPEILDANDATFILAGAFYGLFEEDEFSVSLSKNKKEDSEKTLTDALVKFGIMRELAGRISSCVELNKLNTEDFIYILKNYDNSAVNKAKNLYDLSGIKITVTPKAIEEAAKRANDSGLGVRGANAIINRAIDSKAFDAINNNDKEIRIDKDSLND